MPCQYAYYEDEYPAYLENRAAYTAAERAALREAMEARGIAYVDMGEIFDAEGHLPEFSSKVDNHYGLRGAYVTYRYSRPRSPRTSPSPASITARRRRPRSTRFRAARPSR